MSPLFTERSYIDRETRLDVVVNIVPVVVLALFFLYTLVVNPWGYALPTLVVQHFLTLFPLVLLLVLTYATARVISRDEASQEQTAEDTDS
jgi:uncharacterized membrane protein